MTFSSIQLLRLSFGLLCACVCLSSFAQAASVIRPLCPANEEFKSCGTACEPSCSQPNPICIQKCTAGCFCLPGLLRVSPKGRCVLPKDCPLKQAPEVKVTTSRSKCPKGVVEVACLVDPCSRETCPSHPNAKCVPNFCGGCNAEFFENGEKVECSSSKLQTSTVSVSRDLEVLPTREFLDCRLVDCAPIRCPFGELVVPPESCCPVCRPKRLVKARPRCDNVLCVSPNCGPNDRIVVPEGECCAQCESLEI